MTVLRLVPKQPDAEAAVLVVEQLRAAGGGV